MTLHLLRVVRSLPSEFTADARGYERPSLSAAFCRWAASHRLALPSCWPEMITTLVPCGRVTCSAWSAPGTVGSVAHELGKEQQR